MKENVPTDKIFEVLSGVKTDKNKSEDNAIRMPNFGMKINIRLCVDSFVPNNNTLAQQMRKQFTQYLEEIILDYANYLNDFPNSNLEISTKGQVNSTFPASLNSIITEVKVGQSLNTSSDTMQGSKSSDKPKENDLSINEFGKLPSNNESINETTSNTRRVPLNLTDVPRDDLMTIEPQQFTVEQTVSDFKSPLISNSKAKNNEALVESTSKKETLFTEENLHNILKIEEGPSLYPLSSYADILNPYIFDFYYEVGRNEKRQNEMDSIKETKLDDLKKKKKKSSIFKQVIQFCINLCL